MKSPKNQMQQKEFSSQEIKQSAGILNDFIEGKTIDVRQSNISDLQRIGNQNTQVQYTNDTAENTFFSMTIPGNSMGPNDTLVLTGFVGYTNSGNNKALRVKFGGQLIISTNLTTAQSYKFHVTITNRNSKTAQVTGSQSAINYGTSSSTVQTFTIDTTQNQTLLVTGQMAALAENFGLEAISVKIEK